MNQQLRNILHVHYLKMQDHCEEYKKIKADLLDQASKGEKILTFDNYLKLQEEIDNIQYSGWQFLQIYRNKKELDERTLEIGKPLLLKGQLYHSRRVFDTKRKLPSIPDIVITLANRVIDIHEKEVIRCVT